MKHAIAITPQGAARVIDVDPASSQHSSLLNALYAEIDCKLVEYKPISPNLDVWFDEEFHLTKTAEPNPFGTELAAKLYASAINATTVVFPLLHGTVVFVGRDRATDEAIDIPEDILIEIRFWLIRKIEEGN